MRMVLRGFILIIHILEVSRVKIAPADTASKIFDIIEPYRAPVTIGEILPWVLIASLLLHLCGLAIKYLKKYKEDQTRRLKQSLS